MGIRGYAGLALLLLIAVFTVQNAEVVTVHFLLWKLSVSRALMIFFVLVIGIVIGAALSGISRHRHHDRP
jgi:putative membrane protein